MSESQEVINERLRNELAAQDIRLKAVEESTKTFSGYLKRVAVAIVVAALAILAQPFLDLRDWAARMAGK